MDWDREETIGKVRASQGDVITKHMYCEHQIIYSRWGEFPVLDELGLPPAGLEWQKTPQHGLVINGNAHLIKAVEVVINGGSEQEKTFLAANQKVQGYPSKLSTAAISTARTCLFLIRLFATAIG